MPNEALDLPGPAVRLRAIADRCGGLGTKTFGGGDTVANSNSSGFGRLRATNKCRWRMLNRRRGFPV